MTILEAAPVPLERALGPAAAGLLADLPTGHGVRLRTSVLVEELVGDVRVSGVRLAGSGEIVPADIVVLGLGADPDVGWLAGTGLRLDGGLRCDENGHTGVGAIYGVGDCAAWFDPELQRHHRVEHWTDSRDRPARVVAHLLGLPKAKPLAEPYFWSDQYGVRLQFAGRLTGEEQFVVDSGSIETEDLLGVYLRAGAPVAVLGINRLKDVARWRRRLRENPNRLQQNPSSQERKVATP